MSLLWIEAVRHGLQVSSGLTSWDKEVHPFTHQEQMAPEGELSQATEPLWPNLRPGTATWERVHRLKESMQAHGGYSPERHGELHLMRSEPNLRLHAEHPDWPKAGAGNHGDHVVMAMNLGGHDHRVPVTVHDAKDPDRVRYYHGTSRQLPEDEGELLRSSGYRPGWPSSHEHTYATTSPDSAEHYADTAHATYGGRPRVYEVHPVDPSDLEEDNSVGAGGEAFRSRAGWEIGHEVRKPRSLHEYLNGDEHDEDEDDDDEGWG